MNLIVLPAAQSDIREISQFLSDRDAKVAKRFLDRLEQTLNVIADFPFAGAELPSRHNDLRGLRCTPVSRFMTYVVFYVVNDEVHVLRILHHARDRAAILRDEP